jgi:16S rRNA (uracil1498-N3)-methyltransferase
MVYITPMDDFFKWPRLFVPEALTAGAVCPLSADQAHYIAHVLRKKPGDPLRLFNGQDGEWKATVGILSKKSAEVKIDSLIRPQATPPRRVHFFFSPIKKQRQDWMIEKAVELGATDFHPVLTRNTEVREINEDRMRLQLHEAAEQNERLDIPALNPLIRLERLMETWDKTQPLLACIERADAAPVRTAINPSGDITFLIGPEGGFTREEKALLGLHATPVTLGDTVLRCETAAVMVLSLIKVL